ncbi:MAG: DUF4294 domain-containing protein [Salinivirgaceae bacterium]|jgi:hypothetical protein|nr:DUF4294 domain-containing protein [Salinivirgaceae bacterium]
MGEHKNRGIVLVLACMLITGIAKGQNDSSGFRFFLPITIENGDTLGNVTLRDIVIYPRRDLSRNTRATRQYLRLVKKIRRAYPYAQLAVHILESIYDTLPNLDTKRQQKRFLKAFDKALRERYMDELKNLTVTEGRILLKLIDRETGYTSFYLVEELRGQLSAIFWQSLARLFGENLKTQYEPLGEDRIIEEIVVKIETGRLEPLPPSKK